MARSQALPDSSGYYGRYGGRFVPETLMAPIAELAQAYDKARKDRSFKRRLADLNEHYSGRPTPSTSPNGCRRSWGAPGST